MLANILAVGLIASVMSFSPRYVVDNQNNTITFTAEELNNNTYQDLASKMNEIQEDDISNTSITYNNLTYNFYMYDENDYVDYANGDLVIRFSFNELYSNYGKWEYMDNNEGEYLDFEYSLTINNAEWYIANLEEPPSLTLSKYDLNNKTYTYLAEQINNSEDLDLSNTSITYNNETYEMEEMLQNDSINYRSANDNVIYLIIDTQSENYGKWNNQQGPDLTPFTASMTINNAEWFLENINAPLDSGDMMTAITSGLPLMASLAQAFLNGFTSIFWNSTTGTLTTFSNFALIMLSVAIVFACIKLVLNVVRSNTGV